ncbi:mannose-6-phosphate isomerase [Candidatus Vecturithrix granuli]|uniref:Mannose-6-phosphate isomerase n=1 Tax=Vecturithrix granuli TaxID=1499967 RepID=A0A0S6WCD4_VECG1|nr:mannose-6-phosphate isomerase [Candidatus Vecturithrix granuli]
MTKLILPGFKEVPWSTRLISWQEALSECMTMANCDLQVFFLDYPAGTIRTTHLHEEIRLVFVRCGKVTMTVEDQTTEFQPGDMIALLPNTLHSLTVLGEDPLRLAEFIITPIKHKRDE